MSTCAHSCHLDVCSGKDSDLSARLAIIFGVLDSCNGLLGILVAILIGYLQVRQWRQLHRRQPTIDEPEEEVPIRQQSVEHLIKTTENAA